MPETASPDRQPIAERVEGVVTRLGESTLLSSRKLPIGDELARGDLVVRYGITYLGKPQLSVVPDLVVADYGAMLQGEEAWTFLMDQGHLYPRADVCGMRNDGQQDMVVLKRLDFEYPYDVFVYQDIADNLPLARLTAIIAADRAKFPERLTEAFAGLSPAWIIGAPMDELDSIFSDDWGEDHRSGHRRCRGPAQCGKVDANQCAAGTESSDYRC